MYDYSNTLQLFLSLFDLHILFLFKISTEVDRLTKDFEKSSDVILVQTHTRGNNKGISLQEFNLLAAFHVVCQENVPLFS